MKDVSEAISALELFNEKARKLAESSFVRDMQGDDVGVKISGKRTEDGGFQIKSERTGPSQESIDAFALTLRFFIQNNELSSLAILRRSMRNSHSRMICWVASIQHAQP